MVKCNWLLDFSSLQDWQYVRSMGGGKGGLRGWVRVSDTCSLII